MIWKTAEPITTKTKRAWKKYRLQVCSIERWNFSRTYNQLWTNGVFIISFGGFDHVSPFGNVFGIFLVSFPHLWCARHLEAISWLVELMLLMWITMCNWLMCSAAAALSDLLLELPTLQTARTLPQNCRILPADLDVFKLHSVVFN